MSRTVAESSAAYRKRRTDKMARYEAALREIAAMKPGPWFGASEYDNGRADAYEHAAEVAINGLNGSARDD